MMQQTSRRKGEEEGNFEIRQQLVSDSRNEASSWRAGKGALEDRGMQQPGGTVTKSVRNTEKTFIYINVHNNSSPT